jgi:uncharacterized protein (TIGR02588 family)
VTQQKKRERTKTAAQIPLVEWVAAAIGLALAVSMLAFLVYSGVTTTSSTPALAVHAESIQAQPQGYAVTVRAVNHAGTTAADVKILGELLSGAQVVESAEMTLRYIPARSEQRGGLLFRNDPRKHELRLRAQGYGPP